MANKLELTWVGKENEIKVESRILIENPALSNMSHKTAGQASIFDIENANGFDNMLIHGDNLLALKALESKFAGQVKCIYIDPPYNTGSAFEHYDDNLEHSTWLNLMRVRLLAIYNLLSKDGALFVQIDAVEMPYLKVLLDEIFNRKNFINIITVKTKNAGVSGSNLGKSLQDNTEYILLYAKDVSLFNIYVIPQKQQELMDYINTYNQQGKSWKYTSVLKSIDNGIYVKSFSAGNGDEIKLYKHNDYEIYSINSIAQSECGGDIKRAYYKYVNKVFRTTNAQTSIRTKVIEEIKEFDGKGMFSIEYIPQKGRNAGKKIRAYYKDDNLIAWLKDVVKTEGARIFKLDNCGNLWDDIQYNNLTKEGDVQFPNGKKPEQLIQRVISMATQEGDIILDSFLGSGSTAATAHKMGRRWIGIEMGEHAYTHCKVRLDKVIDGNDQGGITKATNWKGGGGYRFYELAPTLVVTDKFGNPVINKEYNADMLAAAMALQEGFAYCPDDTFYWKQGKNENAYIFTTTSHVTADYLASIHSEMQNDEYLVIACKTYDSGIEKLFKNITVKKIPQVLLGRCEFGKNDYSLNIVDMRVMAEEE